MLKKRALNRVYLYFLSIILILMFIPLISSDAQKNEFTFVFFADIQDNEVDNRYVVFRSLLRNALENEEKPEFLFFAGDIVDDGDDESQWKGFEAAMRDEAQNLDFYTCVGNHDDTQLQKKYFDINKHSHINGDNSFYSFDYKNVHFTVMDSNLMGAATDKSISWLENDLKNTDAKYKIAVFHHPAYVAVNNPKDMARAKAITDAYVPVMEQHGVNLVLNGHQHVYMRTHPIKNNRDASDGIVYMIGNSSTKKYSSSEYDYTAVSKDKVAAYSIISIKNDLIFVRTNDNDGNLIDSFYIDDEDK